ncbi:MAG: right-handed parallel beta-helix repeat-containing protein [Anaerolineales bacterium]|nr:right-handed parallel beta-helix repeat-containing protein [Anaerolineales bacterium]
MKRAWLLGLLVLWLPGRVMAAPQMAVRVGLDENGLTTIFVDGAGETTTIPEIQTLLGGDAGLLENLGQGVWLLHANLLVGEATTLGITGGSGAAALRLRSDETGFVYLRTNDGVLVLGETAVSSWNPTLQTVDENDSDGRAYILARGNARLDIRHSEVSYLGWSGSESYGVAWRDVNDPAQPDVLRSRVTGDVEGSTFHHNYYGIYTHQASQMTFRGNTFRDNIRYGFDPHDYTHDVVVEDNFAYHNGSHGFIISRGCFNFVFRRNVAYENSDPGDNLAHGFMLDPGSPSSDVVQAPSVNNVLEDNEARDNEGYGLRVRGSNDNTIRRNNFHNNLQGIVLDEASQGNLVVDNAVYTNTVNGIYLRGTADHNQIIGNAVGNNVNNGIYVKSDGNELRGNLVLRNDRAGVAFLPEREAAVPQVAGNVLADNIVGENGIDGFDLRSAVNTIITSNESYSNGRHGFYLTDGAQDNQMQGNSAYGNGEHGIRANGVETRGNSWRESSIYGNGVAGIVTTSDANDDIAPPVLTSVVWGVVVGTAVPDATLEIYADTADQARFFVGQTVADENGRFRFTNPNPWPAAMITAVATDLNGNSSGLATAVPAQTATYLPIVRRGD